MAERIPKGPFWWKDKQQHRKWHYGGRYALNRDYIGSECGRTVATSWLLDYGKIRRVPSMVTRCTQCQANYLRRKDG